MKRTLLIVALAVAGTPAFAGEGDIDILPYGYVSHVMRAAPADARTAGAISGNGEVNLDAASTKTRAQVAAETREAQRLGLVVHSDVYPVTPSPRQ